MEPNDKRISCESLKLLIKDGKLIQDLSQYYTVDTLLLHYENLKTLQGFPYQVNGYFEIFENKVENLEGTPSIIHGSYICSHNRISSLHNIHLQIKSINGAFRCSWNPLKECILGLVLIPGITSVECQVWSPHRNPELGLFLNPYLNKGKSALYKCAQVMINAGYPEYAKL